MKKTILYLVILFIFASCQKDIDEFVPDDNLQGPDTTWHNTIGTNFPVALLKNSLSLEVQRDSFQLLNQTITITTALGLTITLPTGSIIHSNGLPVSGNVSMELYNIKKKGDMIRIGTPTVSNGSVIVSSGQFYLKLLSDTSALHLSQGSRIYLNYNDVPQPVPLKVFNGQSNTFTSFNWIPNSDTANTVYGTPGTVSYTMTTNRLGWLNSAYFYDTANARTIVTAGLPNYFTNANTMAFVVFDDRRSVIAMEGNTSSRKFSSVRLPGNEQVTVVVISRLGDDLYLGHEQALTIAATSANFIQQVQVVPVKTTLDNIKAYLNNL